MVLDPRTTINGSHCKVYHGSYWLAHAKSLEFQAEINYEDIVRSGTRTVGKKATTIEYTGTLSGYKVGHNLAKAISQITNDRKGSYVTEITALVNDPENPSAKQYIRIKGVQFSTIPVLNFEAGAILEEELPFTASGFEYI